jgi:SecD/SecF fusion protein
VLSLIALVGATAAVPTSVPTLGLDLRGGTQVVLEAQDSPSVQADAESTDRALEVLRRRVDALGVAEPTLVRAGDRRIVVELPGLQEPRKAVEVIGRTAQLTFHPVLGVEAPGEQPPEGEGTDPASYLTVLLDESGAGLRLGPAALTGEGVDAAIYWPPAPGAPRSAGVAPRSVCRLSVLDARPRTPFARLGS